MGHLSVPIGASELIFACKNKRGNGDFGKVVWVPERVEVKSLPIGC